MKLILRKPEVLDSNRMLRGDYFVKPTAYWFFNCSPTRGETLLKNKQQHLVWEKDKKCSIVAKGKGLSFAKDSNKAGLCSEERSMISPDYARNFICDFIIGKTQTFSQLQLF